jgi:uncharacterized membrane protein YcaP (DUF421 family)
MHGIEAVIGRGTPMEITWWQMSLRAVIVFIYGVLLVRIAGKRAFGRQSALDIVVTVLIGANLSRALTGGSPFFPTLAATTALVLLYWIGIQLAQRSDAVGLVLKGRQTVLVRDGRVDPLAMRKAAVSHLDLDEAVRSARQPGLDAVTLATLERNGHISVVPKRGNASYTSDNS